MHAPRSPRAGRPAIAWLLASIPAVAVAGTLDLQVDGGRVQLRAEDVSASEVLDALAAAAGFELVMRPGFDQPVSLVLEDAPLEKALRRVIGDRSAVIVHAPPEPGTVPRVLEVRVYGAAGRTPAPRAAPATAAPPPTSRATEAAEARRLWNALRNANRARRLELMDKLRREHPPGSVGALSEALRNDPDPMVRARSARILAGMGGPDATRALRAGLGDADAGVRGEILRGIARGNGETAVLALGQTLIGDRDPELRALAVELLVRRREPAAQAFIEQALTDPDEAVRQAAALAASRRGK